MGGNLAGVRVMLMIDRSIPFSLFYSPICLSSRDGMVKTSSREWHVTLPTLGRKVKTG